MARLTVRIDGNVAAQAKKYARARGTSVSALVQGYLQSLTAPGIDPPILHALRGKLTPEHPDDYLQYLAKRYE